MLLRIIIMLRSSSLINIHEQVAGLVNMEDCCRGYSPFQTATSLLELH